MMTPSPPKHRHRSSTSVWPSKSDDGSDVCTKLRKSKTHVSIGQALTMAALSATFAAVVTAMIAVYCFSSSLPDIYSDRLLVAVATSDVISQATHLRPAGYDTSNKEADGIVEGEAKSPSLEALPTASFDASMLMPNVMSDRHLEDDGVPANIAWLMSFPNSGTSFTIHMTRESTNCTTATNYALEGEIKDQPSVQAIPGPAGELGPWLELIPDRHTNVPEVILTKTHCKAFCSGKTCGPKQTLQSARSFMIGCLSGERAVLTDDGSLEVLVGLTYKPERVKKAIHLFRHPLDNVVARFNLVSNEEGDAGNADFTKLFPKNATGFQRWCALDDLNHELLKERLVDRSLRRKMVKIPCFNEFFRYVQWHNLAFSTSHDMGIPTMLLHYHEYSDDFEGTRDRVLEFLEMTRVGEGIEFHSGKEYHHYYTKAQRTLILDFLEEFSSADTWGQIKRYDFEE